MHTFTTPFSRRRFLAALGTGSVGVLAAACGDNPSGPSPSHTLSGNVFGTFDGRPLLPANATADGSAAVVTGNHYEFRNLSAGIYDVSVEGNQVGAKRSRINVDVHADVRLDVDAIEVGYPLNIDHYRTMCLGISAPQPFGGSAQNPGRSLRLRPAINPSVVVVNTFQAPQPYYDAINDARSAFSEFTRGLLNSGTISFVDTEPSNVPPGTVVFVFGSIDHFSTVLTRIDGFDIVSSTITGPAAAIDDYLGILLTMKHEYGHAIGFDHTASNGSLMAPGGPYPGTPSQDDADAGFLKYMRLAGHVLDEHSDRD